MRGQISLFVIIGILIVTGVALTVYLVSPLAVSAKLAPVENKIIECASNAATDGASILGEQGGYITLPKFEAGSEYAPFTSQFNYFGSTMPYWFYKSGNGIYKEQVPTISSMSKQLGDYISQQIIDCDLSSLESQNYAVEKSSTAKTSVLIRDNEIQITVNWPVTVTLGDTTERIASHAATIKNNLGSSYNIAKKIYDEEKNKLFLEEYARDVIVLYAPGTDVALQCSPKIWSKNKVLADIRNGLEANFQTIKFSGNYYDLKSKEEKYFVHDIGENIDVQANVVYTAAFPTKIDVEPSEGDIMRANPIGLQEGLGVLGFCYVPYHFVYSAMFPVIIQVYDKDYNLFQYPLMVEIKNNLPRNSNIGEQPNELEVQFCKYMVQDADVFVTDNFGNALNNVTVSYKCDNTVCNIGQTENGELNAGFPQCVNGYIVAQKEGYSPSKLEFSTNEGGSAAVTMNRLYGIDFNILADGNQLGKNETAIVSFVSSDYSTNVYYPGQKTVSLVEGVYNVSATIFKSGNLELAAQSSETCIKVPREDILGFFGVEREECYEINIPTQILSQLTFGGGKAVLSVSEDELAESSGIELSVEKQNTPKNIDELQSVYDLISASELKIRLS